METLRVTRNAINAPIAIDPGLYELLIDVGQERNAAVSGKNVPPGPTDAPARKLAAKRINERVKLLANLLNSLGIGVIGAGVIMPGVHDPTRVTLQTLAWIAMGLVLHLSAQSVLAFMRSED